MDMDEWITLRGCREQDRSEVLQEWNAEKEKQNGWPEKRKTILKEPRRRENMQEKM